MRRRRPTCLNEIKQIYALMTQLARESLEKEIYVHIYVPCKRELTG